MPQYYLNEADADDATTLPTVWVVQLTAHEYAETLEEEGWKYSKRFPLATMNSHEREKMFDVMVEELDLKGGWMWCICFPGCLPESGFTGPFDSPAEALQDARDTYGDDC